MKTLNLELTLQMIKWTRLGRYKSGEKTKQNVFHAVFKPAVSLLKNAQTVVREIKEQQNNRMQTKASHSHELKHKKSTVVCVPLFFSHTLSSVCT